MKVIFAFASLLVLVGCGSTPVKPEVSVASAPVKYSIEKIDVNLTQAIQVEGYPNKDEFTKILTDKTIEVFKKNNLLAAPTDSDSMTASISVDYRRNFAGDATPMPSKSVVAPTVDYVIIIFDHGVEKKRIVKSKQTTGKGFVGNLGTVFTMGLGNTAKDELIDIEKLANTFASDLLKLN